MDSFKAEEWDWGVGGLGRSSSRKQRQPWEDTKQRRHRPSICFTADVAVFVQHRLTRLPHVLIRKYYKHDPDPNPEYCHVLFDSDFNFLHVCFVSCVFIYACVESNVCVCVWLHFESACVLVYVSPRSTVSVFLPPVFVLGGPVQMEVLWLQPRSWFGSGFG